MAKTKAAFRPVIVALRELTKRKLSTSRISEIKEACTLLAECATEVKHPHLIEVWGLFWDDRKVYFIQEPVLKTAALDLTDLKCFTPGFSSEKQIGLFEWQRIDCEIEGGDDRDE